MWFRFLQHRRVDLMRLPVLAGCAGLVALLLSPAAPAAPESWDEILTAAKGQTVYFHAWGGSEAVNDYIRWAAETVAARHGVEVRHTRIGDAAETVSRLLAEKSAGRTEDGTVDLVWINGENFAAMKENGLLGAPFAESLPNFRLVDTVGKPTTLVDFTVPTDGLESPWGMAQLVFLYDTARVGDPPRDIRGFADWAEANPGRFTYPQPPAFHGTTFLKQALIGLTDNPEALQHPVDPTTFDRVTEPLWAFLDQLHPHLWRQGRAFPHGGPELIQLLGDGEIDIAFSFNPSEANAAIADGRLQESVRSYVLAGGTIGNTHFVAIPFNARAREGAMVFADFLLSPEAQLRKADPAVWGDPTVLDPAKLDPEEAAALAALSRGAAGLTPEELGTPLPEPHPSWTEAIEAEWQRRYAR